MDQSHIDKLKIKLSVLLPELNEKQKRYAVALEAKSIGWGGIKILSQITGMSQTTIRRGLSDLNVGLEKISGVRKKGGGRKKLKLIYPELVKKLETIIDEATRGDPETPLRWTCKSVRNIADLLSQTGKKISHMTVCRLLHALQFSLKGNKKTKEGNDHPDRDKQFRYIAKISKMALNEKLPVISVDTKKKELVGNFKNGGREWSKAKKPIEVNAHDFPGPKVPQARPFGVYDIGANKGWVSVGVSADTAEFAVNSIRGWWRRQGCKKYLKAKSLLIFADAGEVMVIDYVFGRVNCKN